MSRPSISQCRTNLQMSNTPGTTEGALEETGRRQGETVTAMMRGRDALSLRALMILVLVLGGGFGWTVNRANSRRRAVDAVKKAKGTVSFDYQYANEQFKPAGKPWPPASLLTLLPEEYFHDVTRVNILNLAQSEEDDAKIAMSAISKFDWLERLRIIEPPPGTAISGLDRLKVLRVTLTRQIDGLPISERRGRKRTLRYGPATRS